MSSHVQITFHQLCCELKDILRIRDGAIRSCYIKSWRQVDSMDRMDTYRRGSSPYIAPAHTRCGLEKGKNVSNVSTASEVTDWGLGLSWPKREQITIHAMDSEMGEERTSTPTYNIDVEKVASGNTVWKRLTSKFVHEGEGEHSKFRHYSVE